MLPCVEVVGAPLVFREWSPGDDLVEEPFGTCAPAPPPTPRDPDVLLVPLLAIDRSGYRLGYGGGFYDRTLEALRAIKSISAVGVAYAAQEVPAVPRDEGDQPVDLIVTEREVIRPSRAPG